MGFTPEQIKGRIKSVAKQNNADARTLMRIYMMERFLERLAQSEYRDNFIIKGGILVTAMIGVAHRSTMDIDTSMKNLNLSAEDALRVVNQVKDIDLDDGVSFEVKDVSNIMDEMEYPGIRVTMNANVGRLITPLKIDISTGDVITPRAIEFNYDLLLEDRSISLWSYNLETILAEKLQTVLARGILNTRMRDFYDIRMLLDTYEDKVNKAVLKDGKVGNHPFGNKLLLTKLFYHGQILLLRHLHRERQHDAPGKLGVPLVLHSFYGVPEGRPVCISGRRIGWQHDLSVDKLFLLVVEFCSLVVLAEQPFAALVSGPGNSGLPLAALDDGNFEMRTRNRHHPQTKRPPSKIALGERSGIVFGFARRLRTECHALRSQAGAAKG